MASLAIIGLTALLAHGVRGILPAASLMLLFLVAVLIASVRFGFWTGIVASVLAFLAYNFFFIEPLFTLHATHAEDVLALGTLLFAAGMTGLLAGRVREEANAAQARAGMLERLSVFAADLGSAADLEAIERVVVRYLAVAADGAAVLLKPEGERLVPRYSVPAGLELDGADHQAAERAYRRGVREQGTAPGWSGSRFTFQPLAKAGAVIGYRPARRASGRDDGEQVPEAIVQQGRLAMERARFAGEAVLARATAERESLRASLLSSLSHDLKTPLATIVGSVTSLRQLGAALNEEARSDLLLAIEEEAERLSRYVSNLLHMTRLRTGLDLRLDWIDVVDAAHGAIERARRAYPGRAMILKAPSDIPLICADAILLEQALFNIIDNAAKFSPADEAVDILLARDGDRLRITVSDKGQGIEEGERAHIFEPFFRGAKTSAAGTGLGLAIARGIVQALGGTVVAESPGPAGLGTAIHIRLALRDGSTA